jgi:hypothetical protein
LLGEEQATRDQQNYRIKTELKLWKIFGKVKFMTLTLNPQNPPSFRSCGAFGRQKGSRPNDIPQKGTFTAGHLVCMHVFLVCT